MSCTRILAVLFVRQEYNKHLVPISSHEGLASARPAAKNKFTASDRRGTAAGKSSEPQSALVRAGKRFLAGAARLNRRVGAAEARFILRVFYITVIGAASLVLRKARQKSIDEEERAEVAWSPRVSPGTDPTKQY